MQGTGFLSVSEYETVNTIATLVKAHDATVTALIENAWARHVYPEQYAAIRQRYREGRTALITAVLEQADRLITNEEEQGRRRWLFVCLRNELDRVLNNILLTEPPDESEEEDVSDGD